MVFKEWIKFFKEGQKTGQKTGQSWTFLHFSCKSYRHSYFFIFMFTSYMVTKTQKSCAKAEKMISSFVASVGNRNKVARASRKPTAYMVRTFCAIFGASFCCGRLLIGCQRCKRVLAFFWWFWWILQKHQKMKKNYAHNFENLRAFFKIYGKEE